MLNIIASYDNGAQVESLEMTAESLEEWVLYYNAYEAYDSILVNGVEASELFPV